MSACGGGGGGGGGSGETLTVSVAYNGSAELLQYSAVTPTLTGFNGHAPNCSLASGSVPQGMTFNADCSITGTPRESGVFQFVVRVGASGVSNSLTWSGGVRVYGPSIDYAFIDNINTQWWRVGDVVEAHPENNFWYVRGNTTVAYRVTQGALPPGLNLNPTTGVVSGTVVGIGSQVFRIGVTVSSGGQTITQETDEIRTVTALSTQDLYPSYGDSVAWLGQPFVLAPTVPPLAGAVHEFSIDPTTPLPPGLAVDPATGRLMGTATAARSAATYNVMLKLTYQGVESTQSFVARLSATSPVNVDYASRWSPVGTTLINYAWMPTTYTNGSSPYGIGYTYSYAVNASTHWPTGLSLDPSSGSLAGTLTQPFNGQFYVDVNVQPSSGTPFRLTVPVLLEVR